MNNNVIPAYEVTEIHSDQWKGLTILIVEDHEIVWEGMRRLIARLFGDHLGVLEVLQATSLEKARQIVKARAALDLILLDLDLPDASATECARCIESEWTGRPVAIMSASEDWETALEFVKLGALGYIPKKSTIGVVSNALRLIISGGRYFPDEVFELIGSRDWSDERAGNVVAEGLENREMLDDEAGEGLSPRLRDVLGLMLEGHSNKEIARRLGLSVGTTKNYVSTIMRILGVSGRMNVMRTAVLRGASLKGEKSSGTDAADE